MATRRVDREENGDLRRDQVRHARISMLLPARDLGFRKGRHAGVAGHRRLDDPECQGGAGAFAEPKPKIEQRLLAKPPQHIRVPAFVRNMGRHAMVERTGIKRMKNGGGRTNHITIEDHWNALHARRDDRAGDRRDLAAAEAAHHL